MRNSKSQKTLFPTNSSNNDQYQKHHELSLGKEVLLNWQKKIETYQSSFFSGTQSNHKQGTLFIGDDKVSLDNFAPLNLTPLPLSFWRWPKSSHTGPAIYLVMDKLEQSNSHILLYIGETLTADRRWKGEHDCKAYLAAYSEALCNAAIQSQLSIRFWSDVPSDTRSRRKLEQQLINKWLPPFNKETRARWSTPFTAKIN